MKGSKNMRKIISALVFAIIFAISAGPALAAKTWNVPSDGGFLTVYEQKAQSGDIIKIDHDSMSLDINDKTVGGVGGAPYVMGKAITIQGADRSSSVFVSQVGLILGADVTFKDLTISLSNPKCNAVIANGHRLTLSNVKRSETTRRIHLFAGGYEDPKYYAADGYPNLVVPPPGPAAAISLTDGTDMQGNIYLGGMNTKYDGSASLTADKDSASNITGEIWSHGAAETKYEGLELDKDKYEPAPPAPQISYPTSGSVKIDLTDIASSAVINCGTGTGLKSADVICEPGRSSNEIDVRGAKSLTLRKIASYSGTSKIRLASTASLPDGVDISIPDGCELGMSALAKLPQVGTFNGGGTLALGTRQTLTITGDVVNTTTFLTGTAGLEGDVVDKHTYISAAKSTKNSFTFTPNQNQPGYTLGFESGGKWTAHAPASAADPKLTSFSIDADKQSMTVQSSAVNSPDGCDAASFTLGLDRQGFYDISTTPIAFDVKKDGTLSSGQPSKIYESGKETDRYQTVITGAHMKFAWVSTEDTSGHFVVRNDGDPIADGVYEITITIAEALTASGQAQITASFAITVTSGSTPPQPAAKYRVTVKSEGAVGAYGSNEYEEGDPVKIGAGTRSGHKFTGWGITGADAAAIGLDTSKPEQSFTMPKAHITLTASWEPENTQPPSAIAHTVYVYSLGAIGASGSGSHKPGDIVEIDAGQREGHRFVRWVVSGPANLWFDATSSRTWFRMPDSSVDLSAEWELIGGTGTGEVDTAPSGPAAPQADVSDKVLPISTKLWRADAASDVLLKIDIPFDRFLHEVSLNGTALTEGRDWSAHSGSTIILISGDVMRTAPVGENRVRARFMEGTAAHVILVQPSQANVPLSKPPTGDSVSASGGGGGGCTTSAFAISVLTLAILGRSRRRRGSGTWRSGSFGIF